LIAFNIDASNQRVTGESTTTIWKSSASQVTGHRAPEVSSCLIEKRNLALITAI
jgi:hypothetical protein